MPRFPRTVLGSPVRDLIGGRWAISFMALALSAPVGLITTLANMSEVDQPSDLWLWLGMGALGFVVVALMLLLGDRTVFRNRRRDPVPVWSVVAWGALTGGVRSLVVAGVSAQFGLVDSAGGPMAVRTLSGAGLGAVLLPGTALVMATITFYLQQRRELILELTDLEVARMRTSGESEALRAELISDLQKDIERAESSGDAQQIRSVSHRIWEESEKKEPLPRLRFPDVAHATLASNPYPTTAVCAIWSISALGSLILNSGFVDAVAQVGLAIAAIALVFWIARRMTRVYPRAAVATLVMSIVVLVVVTSVVIPVAILGGLSETSAGASVANAVWLPILILGAGFVQAAVRSGDEVLANLRSLVEQTQARAAAAALENASIRREVATRLHSSAQSRLLATAALIRQPKIVQNMNACLDDLVNGGSSAFDDLNAEISLQVRIERLCSAWAGLMGITLTPIEGQFDAAESAAVAQVVEEALSNAFRHGEAQVVDVTITRQADWFQVDVTDDGVGPKDHRVPGLGTAILDSLAPGNWSLSRGTDGRTVLSVVFRGNRP